MRAVRLHGVHDVRIDEIDKWGLAAGEASIKIEACGVCPSEVRSYAGVRKGSAYEHALPRVLGHEWAGVVEEVVPADGTDAAAADIAVGQRVAVDWRCVCGVCVRCRQGRFDMCERTRNQVHGGFAEYGVAPVTQLHAVPDHVSGAEAAFAEPLACVLNGNQALAIYPGDDVVVLGAGPMGLLHTQVALLRGARVIVCDPMRDRLDVAATLGAHELIDKTGEAAVVAAKKLTGGRGADAVVIAVGAAQAAQQGLALAGPTARVNLFAGTFPVSEIPLDPNSIHYPQLSVTGTHDYTPRQFGAATKLIALGSVRVAPLVTNNGGLEEVRPAFERILTRQGLKTMIHPHA